MNVYKISYYSKCGTYFASYLQSVTVVADSGAEAIELVQKWLQKEALSFLEVDPKKWDVEVLGEPLKGVIDWVEDSDY